MKKNDLDGVYQVAIAKANGVSLLTVTSIKDGQASQYFEVVAPGIRSQGSYDAMFNDYLVYAGIDS